MEKFEAAQNLTQLVLDKTGSIFGKVEIKMTAKEQRATFGMFLGKGMIVIDGENETLGHRVSCCFGMDYDYTFNKKWSEI